MRGYSLLLAPLFLAASSCGDANLAPAQRLWTMADLQASSHEGDACINPDGLPCNYFVNTGVAGNDVLQLKLAFAEGQPMAYMTTDFWANYDRVWLEPMYILVTAWNEKLPAANRLMNADSKPTGPIFSVGPQSAFYSPYWQVFYVVVPEGTAPTRYTSARQLFDDHLVMHTGSRRFASIGPDSVSPPSVDDIRMNIAPAIDDYLVNGPGDLAKVVASAKKLTGWLDGAAVSYIDFGTDNFDADAAQVIQDVPLFLFKRLDMNGKLQLANAPNVGGVAPLFSKVKGRLSADNRPQFGAFWRLHIVTLPPTAKVFLEDDAQSLVDAGADAAVLKTMVTRVALNGGCFASRAMLDTCVWLDSQAAIEDNLGEKAITRTALQPACPFVMYRGAPVPNE